MQNVFTDCGMDFMFNKVSNCNKIKTYTRNCINISINNFHSKWYENVRTKSSLSDYALIKDKPYLEDYLLNILDFYAASLKFKARSNTLPINGRSYHWNIDHDKVCPLCKTGKEDLKHFLFTCRTLQDIRIAEFHKLEHNLCSNELNSFWHLFISSNLNIKTCLMLGVSEGLISDHAVDFDFKPVLGIFDIFCKSYLKIAWKFRSDFLN